MDQQVSKNAEEWRATTLHPAKEKTPERKEKFVTSSDIVVPDLTTEEDLRGFDAHKQLGYPGEFPSPPRRPRVWPCAPSRFLPTRPAWQTLLIHWPAHTILNP